MGTKRSKNQDRRQSDPSHANLTLDEIEGRLAGAVLSAALALYIIKNSEIPTSELIKGLMDVEMDVGEFVSKAMAAHTGKTKAIKWTGFLAGALSFIPFPSRRQSRRSNKRSF